MSILYEKLQLLALVLLVLIIVNRRNECPCQFRRDPIKNLPTIYGITPTYARLVQKADLTRLSQTLMLVENFHWILVEDSENKTDLVTTLLRESKLTYTHLSVKTPKSRQSNMKKGVEQRNLALDWLRGHLATLPDKRSMVYFMDDDNTYSLKIFDEIRKVKKVGIWPVGLVGLLRVERPLVTSGRVVGFNTVWKQHRPFPIDMAGFAINATLFLEHPEAKFTRDIKTGYQETAILEYFTSMEELEPIAEDCTRVYVWHTRTVKPKISELPALDRDIEV